MSVFFSIITSTNNRKHELAKLIESLESQKFKNFEWIIGDDGSIDGTDNFIKSRMKNATFKVKYIRSSHRIGLSKMINILMKYVQGKIFFLCDSDDYLTFDTLIKVKKLFKKLDNKKNNNIVGILSGNIDEKGNNQLFYKNKIPKKNSIMNWLDVNDITYGDGTLFAYSKFFKKLKLKEVDFYIPMSTLYKSFKYKQLLVTHQSFKIMKRDTKNSISFQKKLSYNRGNAYAISICETSDVFFGKTLISKIKLLLNYFRYCIHGDIKLLESIKLWQVIKKNNLLIIFFYLSYIIVFKDFLFKKIDKTHIQFNRNKKIAIITKVTI